MPMKLREKLTDAPKERSLTPPYSPVFFRNSDTQILHAPLERPLTPPEGHWDNKRGLFLA